MSQARRRAQLERAVTLHRRVCELLGQPLRYRNDVGEVMNWLDQDIAEDRVLAAIERVMRRDGAQLPFSLKYFRGAVADSTTRKRKSA